MPRFTVCQSPPSSMCAGSQKWHCVGLSTAKPCSHRMTSSSLQSASIHGNAATSPSMMRCDGSSENSTVVYPERSLWS